MELTRGLHMLCPRHNTISCHMGSLTQVMKILDFGGTINKFGELIMRFASLRIGMTQHYKFNATSLRTNSGLYSSDNLWACLFQVLRESLF